MQSKYELVRLTGGWAVTMSANGRIMGIFKAKRAATNALEEFERGERFVNPKPDVWVVGDAFVLKAEVGGLQLGEVRDLDMGQFNVVQRLTQEEFDALQEAYYEEHGHYPDT